MVELRPKLVGVALDIWRPDLKKNPKAMPRNKLPLWGEIGTKEGIFWFKQEFPFGAIAATGESYALDVLQWLGVLFGDIEKPLSEIRRSIKTGSHIFTQPFVINEAGLFADHWTPFSGTDKRLSGFFWGGRHLFGTEEAYTYSYCAFLAVCSQFTSLADEMGFINTIVTWYAADLALRNQKRFAHDLNTAYREAGSYVLDHLVHKGTISDLSLLHYDHDETGKPLYWEPFAGYLKVRQKLGRVLDECWTASKLFKATKRKKGFFRCPYCGKEESRNHHRREYCKDSHRVLFCRAKKLILDNRDKLPAPLWGHVQLDGNEVKTDRPMHDLVSLVRKYLRRHDLPRNRSEKK